MQRAATLMKFTVFGSFCTAVTFAAVIAWLMHGPRGLLLLLQPITFLKITTYSLAANALIFPSAFLLLRNCDLRRANVVIFGTVQLATVVLTPWLHLGAIPVLLVITIAAMAGCRWLMPLSTQAPNRT